MKCADAERALKKLGFNEVTARRRGSHSRWECVQGGHKYKVTLDCHRGEVKAKDVRSIASQAGVSVRDFYRAAYG